MLTVGDISLYELEGDIEAVISKLVSIKQDAYDQGLSEVTVDVEEDLNGTAVPYLVIRGIK